MQHFIWYLRMIFLFDGQNYPGTVAARQIGAHWDDLDVYSWSFRGQWGGGVYQSTVRPLMLIFASYVSAFSSNCIFLTRISCSCICVHGVLMYTQAVKDNLVICNFLKIWHTMI